MPFSNNNTEDEERQQKIAKIEEELIQRIMIGCTKDVLNQERIWHKKGFKFGKLSDNDRTRLLINRRFYSGPQTAFNQKDIKLQFSEKFGEATDPSELAEHLKRIKILNL